MNQSENFKSALSANVAARILWGGATVYLSLLSAEPVMKVLTHRIGWSCLFAFFIVLLKGELKEMGRVFMKAHSFFYAIVATFLISSNWFTVIGTVGAHDVMSASLGFYMAPLFTALLGFLVLNERLTIWHLSCFGLVGAGVGILFYTAGTFPLKAVWIGGTMALYNLVKKRTPLPAMVGICIESLIAFPVSLAVSHFQLGGGLPELLMANTYHYWLLMGTGIVTTVPMILFTTSLKHLPLNIVGLLQYLTPTAMMVAAVAVLHEKVAVGKWVGFGFVWVAIVVMAIYLFRSGFSRRVDPIRLKLHV